MNKSKINNVYIDFKDGKKLLLSKNEIANFVNSVEDKQFVNRSQAKKITNLSYIGGVNSSSKVKKGKKLNYNTYIVYLNPYKNIFGNVCPMAVTCVDSCLNTSGRVKMDVHEFTILKARYLKTILFYVNRQFFNDWLFAELEAHKNKDNFMVRLNGTSDLSLKLFKNSNNVNVLDKFKDVQFYDYTKVIKRVYNNTKQNYHLTFSYDGLNMAECLEAQKLGINVSIVVDGKIPKTFKGKRVFDMDETDLRPLDKYKGAFGYLKLKETLNKKYDSRFVLSL